VHKNCKKLMPLVHLPVQSGSDNILKSMNRKHNIEEYLEIIRKLRKVKSNIQFSSDFIIGYPGETQTDYEKTIKLLKEVKFINSYSFIFSARPGTPAYNLKKIDEKVAKERLINFQNIAEKIKRDYREKLINVTLPVLFENEMNSKNRYFGRDKYSNSVVVESAKNLEGKLKYVKIIKSNQNTMFGKVVENFNRTNYAA